MPTRNINLTDHFDEFVGQLVATGQYKNASEVMRAGLRLLEAQALADQQKLALLKKLAMEGFESIDQGHGLDLPDDDALAQAIANLGNRAVRAALPPGAP